MKFKAGDYVKIKEGLTRTNTSCFVTKMEEYCGKIAKVVKVYDGGYSLDIDNGEWCWYEYMFESAQKKTYSVIVVGNTVTVTDDKGNTGVAKCSPDDEFNLSTGISLAIERLKWKPRDEEHYWTIDFSLHDYVRGYQWENDDTDNSLFRSGLVFKTVEEAMEAAKKMLEVV